MTSDMSLAEHAVLCDDAQMKFGEVLALPRTSLLVEHGSSVAIMGPSGSGKSTLLGCIQGLVVPTSGSVTVLGQDQRAASRRARSDLRRRRMGLVQQSSDLLEEFSAVENVAFPLLFEGTRRPAALARAAAAVELVGLAHRADADVRSLSGGEAQRIAIARALVHPDASLIIADEPTASLDVDSARTVTELLLYAAQDREATVVLATHDPSVAGMCDRVFRLVRDQDET